MGWCCLSVFCTPSGEKEIFYSLIIGSMKSIEDSVLIQSNKSIAFFRKAVFSKNSNNLHGYDITDLNVYPPGTENFDDALSVSADPEDTVEDVLGNAKPPPSNLTVKQAQRMSHRIIVVARSPPTPPPAPERPMSNVRPPPVPASAPYTAALTTVEMPSFSAFFEALIRGEVYNDEGQQIIDVQHHVVAGPQKQTKMLIRQCYVDIYELMMNPSAQRRSLLIGTPGIGKSMFGMYMIRRLVQHFQSQPLSDLPVIIAWISGRMNVCVIIQVSSNSAFSIELLDASDGQDYVRKHVIDMNPKNWVVYDAIKPMRAVPDCRAVLISSPRSEDTLYSEWSKGECTEYFMPVWSDDEMMAAQNVIFRIPDATYAALHQVLGNVPRHVFEESSRFGTERSEVLQYLEKKFNNPFTLESLRSIYASIHTGLASKITHYLMHIVTNSMKMSSPFYSYSVQFASVAVEELVMQKLESSEKDRQALWMAVSKEHAEYGSLRGILFERYAHRFIRTYAGPYDIKRLQERAPDDEQRNKAKKQRAQTEPDSHVQFRVTGHQTYSTITEATAFANGTYAQPLSRNEKAIDSLLQPDSLFQMTVSPQHGVLLNSVRNATAVLREKQSPRLYFVVPSDKYDGWTTAQRYYTTKGDGAKQSVAGLEQYVLKIDIQVLRKIIVAANPPSGL